MSMKTLTRSFAGGVITPEMFGRLDLVKYQTGLAEAINFETLPHGPVRNRSGFEWIHEVKDSTKVTVLLPFVYNTSQAYILEFGDQYVRFITNAGTVLEANTNITGGTQANPGVITSVAHGYANGQWVFLASIGGMTQLNNRFAVIANATANTYTLKDTAGVDINTTAYGAYTAGGTAGRVYEIASPYLTADLPALEFTQSNDVLTITNQTYQQRELRRSGATSWAFAVLAFAPTIAPAGAPTLGNSGGGATNHSYVTTALAPGTLEESLASPSATIAGDLTLAGSYNGISPDPVATAVRYNVYKLLSGLYGFIGQTDGSQFIDNNITPDTSKTPPLVNDPFVGATNYPAAVGYWQGRRWFAGTQTNPQLVDATRSGTESNLSYSIPTRDSDRIEFRIAARQANSINHIVPADDLILLTSGGEWMVVADNSDVLTPSSVDPKPQGNTGASSVRPIIMGSTNAILYTQNRGGRIREMVLALASGLRKYVSNDLSIMAPHLFDNYTITSMTAVRGPNPTAWFVRSDGVLIGLTYVPEHQVAAWHTHTTLNGSFESVCAIPEGTEDVLYATIKRTLNGRTVRSVERQRSRVFTNAAASFFVDAGVVYNSTPATVITGLWHLVGETVSILADGAMVPQQVVSAAATITLPNAASVVAIGKQITARLMTLPVSLETEALGTGTTKNVNKAWMRVNTSSGINAGPTYADVRPIPQRTTEPYGSPPNLFSGEVSQVFTPKWNDDGQIALQQTDPLPVTLLSLTLDVAVGG